MTDTKTSSSRVSKSQYESQITATDLLQYSILSRIGQGSFAYLYRAENTRLPIDSPLRCIAIKRFKPEYKDIGEQEAQIMAALFNDVQDCPHCVRFYAGFEMEGSYLIILELLDWSRPVSLSLISHVSPNPSSVIVPSDLYKTLAKLSVQLLSALVEINMRGYVHCDIKPENILYIDGQSRSKIKIIDFGNATQISDLQDYTDDFELQSPGYRAPEIMIGDPTFNEKIDVWSVGVVLLEILVNHIYQAFRNEWRLVLSESAAPGVLCITKVIEPFDAYKSRNTIFWETEYESTSLFHTGRLEAVSVMMRNLAGIMCEEETSKLALDFLLCLLRVDHTVRWSARQALKHPFLIQTLHGSWGKVLFPDSSDLPPGDSQLKDLRLI